MIAVALAAIVVVACSTVIGQGVCVVAGRREWSWWAPGVGFAAILVIADVLLRHGGRVPAAVGVGVAVLVSLALIFASGPRRGLLPVVEGIPVAAVGVLLSMIPLFVWGRAGLLGEGMNNDSGAHLGTAWWLDHKVGPPPVGALGGQLVNVGYPLGPHGITAALSALGMSYSHAFDGMIISVAPLLALVALGGLRDARLGLRWVAAVLVAFSYMAVSFQVQASFKETIEALLVLTVVLGARDLLREPWARGGPLRVGLPVGLAIASSVYVYSFGGLVWTVAAAGAVGLFAGPFRVALRAVPGVVVWAAVVVVPAIGQMARFSSSPFNHENGNGNLIHAISPFETLGAWFSYDFRWTPDPLWPTVIAIIVVSAAALVAVGRLVRARRTVVLSGVIPVMAIYAYAANAKGIYLSAKAAAVAAPLVAVAIAAGLLFAGVGRRWRMPLVALSVLAALACAWSSFLVLRGARVGPEEHRAELRELRAHITGTGGVLFFPKNDLAQWELVGVNIAVPRAFYAPQVASPDTLRPISTDGFYDFDNYSPKTLDRYRWAITTNSPFQSKPPPNWHEVAHTRSYILWKRRGNTRLQLSTDFATEPGQPFDCTGSLGRLRIGEAGAHGYAAVMPRPIVGLPMRWSAQPRDAGQSATMTLRVPHGRWDLSLTYASNPGLSVDAPGLHVDMPATIDRVGPYYLVGTIVQRHSGVMRIRVTQHQLNWFGRLIGAAGHTRGLDTPQNVPLGGVALTRHGARERRVPVRQACGLYVDHVVPRS